MAQWVPDKLDREDDQSERQPHCAHCDCAEDDATELQGTQVLLVKSCKEQHKHPVAVRALVRLSPVADLQNLLYLMLEIPGEAKDGWG